MNFLKKGDIVDVISPASPLNKAEINKISQFLAKKGLKARFFMEDELVLERKKSDLFPFGNAEARFQQFMVASKSDSKAIWCARGGYGSSDLLPFLHLEKKIKQNKLFIGFSDITALGGFLVQNWGWRVIYGPMLTQLSSKKLAKSSENAIFDLVFGKKKTTEFECEILAGKDFEIGENLILKQEIDGKQTGFFSKNIAGKSAHIFDGILVGGCLSVVMQSLGTVNEIDWKGEILLLEDIDENGEKIARFFEQILQISKHKNSYPKAILLGNFLQYVKDKQKRQNIELAIAQFSDKINKNAPEILLLREKSGKIGHCEGILPVLLG